VITLFILITLRSDIISLVRVMKTNAMRILDSKKIKYQVHDYTNTNAISGLEVAHVLNENPKQVFKTLVVQGKSKNYYVCVIPVTKQLDLKIVAKFLNEKSVDMIKEKELLPLTGYVHGGCSPFGMKKSFLTIVDETANDFDTVMVSGGKVGLQIELNMKEACQSFGFQIVKF